MRTLQACDKCHERKIRCDSARPRCYQCSRSGFVCSYSQSQKAITRPSIHELCERIQHLEQLVSGLVENSIAPPRTIADHSTTEVFQSTSPESSQNNSGRNEQSQDLRILDLNLAESYRDTVPRMYNHSILAMLTTAPNLQSIGRRIGQPDMAQEIIASVRASYKAHENQKKALFMKQSAEHSVLDVDIQQFCKRQYHEFDSDLLYYIVTPEESDHAFGDTGNNSEISAIVKPSIVLLVLSHIRFIGNNHGFTEELLQQQMTIAFMHATKAWSLAGLLPCNPNLFRSLVLYAFATLLFTPLSQDIQALAVAYTTGQQLGLNDAEYCQGHNQSGWQREGVVWNILRTFDNMVSLSASQPPGIRTYENSVPLANINGGSNSDLLIQSYQLQLSEIYEKCYDRVFSRKALKKTHREIFENILQLNDELDAWRSQLPAGMAHPSDNGLFYLSTSSTLPLSPISTLILLVLNMLFFALKIQLHALPAFVKSFLRGVSDDMLRMKASISPNIASEAARSILSLFESTEVSFRCLQLPLYQFCVCTAHQALFMYCTMFPRNQHLQEDIKKLIKWSDIMIGDSPTISYGIFQTVKKILSEFQKNLSQQECFSGGNANSTWHSSFSLPLGETAPSNLVPWVDLEPSSFDQYPVESCQPM